MTNVEFINGYSIKEIEKCEFYYKGTFKNAQCDCNSQNLDSECANNPDCNFKKVLKLTKENDALKNGYGVNCETCTSRLELEKIRDIKNRVVALKENQMVINYDDLQVDGIAFVNIDQMKNYFLTAYRARTEQVNQLKNKIAGYEGQTQYYCECCNGIITPQQRVKFAKDVLEEAIKEIQNKLKKEGNDGKNTSR